MKPEYQKPVSRLKTDIPILGWLPSYQVAWLTADVIAGRKLRQARLASRTELVLGLLALAGVLLIDVLR